MTLRFDHPSALAPTTSWVPQKPMRHPIQKLTRYPDQVVSATANGSLHVQDKGGRQEIYQLNFEGLSASDRDSALAFFDAVKNAFRSFDFTDTEGQVHKVRWMNEFDFKETFARRFSATLELRKDTVSS